MSKSILSLVAVFILALGVRAIALNSRPSGFTWDEAALGYNAYSLLKTGRDEHQKITPIVFESFGDYKPGAYIYLTVPSVAILGLNEFATRLPSALVGSLSVILVWFLTYELFGRSKAIFASLIMALNPWSIYFSRGAWEANVMVFLLLLGFVLAIRKKIVLASIFWGLTLWTYQGAKMITPLLLFGYWWHLGQRHNIIKNYWKPVLVLCAFGLPILLGLPTQGGRLQVANVFNYTRPAEVVQRVMSQDLSQVGSLVYYLFHSEKLDQTRGVVQRYLNHFSPRFLFVDGNWKNGREAIAYYGNFHLPEVLLLILGLVFLFRNWHSGSKFLLWWAIVAPLPAALSRDLVSGVRTLPLTIPLVILIGLGLAQLWNKKILFGLYCCVLIFFLTYFADLYFKHSPYYAADERLTLYKPAIELINQHIADYNQIVFTNKFGQPYIYVLFYNKVDPREFWQTVTRIPTHGGDVGEVLGFGKWQFQEFYWPSTRNLKSTLVVGDELELPETDLHFVGLSRLGWVYYPNGDPALDVVGLK